SGGEQNRAVLATLFSRPVNLLVLDEPTNDLDIETLELLEELLLQYKGTVLLVSHDRSFMDNVVTELLILPGDGSVDEQAGSFSDWEARGGRLLPLGDAAPVVPSNDGQTESDPVHAGEEKPSEKRIGASAPVRAKLSYRERRELEALPGEIETLERRQAELEALSADPDFYTRPQDEVQNLLAELAELSPRLDASIERWSELEERA
ncbi:MAG: ABC transporter ATP-binding protein, partial [Pseudomonadota bacterium]